jgi:hypothetical protein
MAAVFFFVLVVKIVTPMRKSSFVAQFLHLIPKSLTQVLLVWASQLSEIRLKLFFYGGIEKGSVQGMTVFIRRHNLSMRLVPPDNPFPGLCLVQDTVPDSVEEAAGHFVVFERFSTSREVEELAKLLIGSWRGPYTRFFRKIARSRRDRNGGRFSKTLECVDKQATKRNDGKARYARIAV